MGNLHLFFPENDLALARNLEHYTAPPAAIKLRLSGALLGLWYGDNGDKVVDYGTDAKWYNHIREKFALAPEIYDGNPSGLTPAPWGWSKAVRTEYRNLGSSRDALPSDASLDKMRMLSHRRTASAIANALAYKLSFPIAPPAQELTSPEEVFDYIQRTGESILKLPWSSSGRGLILCSPFDYSSHAAEIDSLLKRQGGVMGEPRMNKTMDFALLFTMDSGECLFDGYSVFDTIRFGSYAGNILAPQSALHKMIAEKVPQIDAVAEALPSVLEEIIGSEYSGPLGIDMMAVDGAPYSIAPAVELNLRMTMGHVCRRFYEQHVVDGCRGRFSVVQGSSGIDDTTTEGTRISAGRVSLSPPHSFFSFEVKI